MAPAEEEPEKEHPDRRCGPVHKARTSTACGARPSARSAAASERPTATRTCGSWRRLDLHERHERRREPGCAEVRHQHRRGRASSAVSGCRTRQDVQPSDERERRTTAREPEGVHVEPGLVLRGGEDVGDAERRHRPAGAEGQWIAPRGHGRASSPSERPGAVSSVRRLSCIFCTFSKSRTFMQEGGPPAVPPSLSVEAAVGEGGELAADAGQVVEVDLGDRRRPRRRRRARARGPTGRRSASRRSRRSRAGSCRSGSAAIDVALVLDRARPAEHLPVRRAGREGERRRHEQHLARRRGRAGGRAPGSGGRSRSRGRACRASVGDGDDLVARARASPTRARRRVPGGRRRRDGSCGSARRARRSGRRGSSCCTARGSPARALEHRARRRARCRARGRARRAPSVVGPGNRLGDRRPRPRAGPRHAKTSGRTTRRAPRAAASRTSARGAREIRRAVGARRHLHGGGDGSGSTRAA